ncbi:zinc finger BED domain-containing protein 5 [Trichonephila clavipes]|nr:zinc finger BED domain-containing protein 5 [Trichonephila clavipes]
MATGSYLTPTYSRSQSPKEELLGLLPLKGQTHGKDIANAVTECMDKHHIPLDKIVSISTDGAKKALCTQTFPDEICKVMELVIPIINYILAKALNHRQFKEFLFEMESENADLLLHNKPDSSPIEHVGDMKGSRLRLPGNADHLAQQLEQIWQEILQETIRVPYHSMPRRVAAYIEARCGSTPY